MPKVACEIVEWIADERFPGIVRVVLTDATGEVQGRALVQPQPAGGR